MKKRQKKEIDKRKRMYSESIDNSTTTVVDIPSFMRRDILKVEIPAKHISIGSNDKITRNILDPQEFKDFLTDATKNIKGYKIETQHEYEDYPNVKFTEDSVKSKQNLNFVSSPKTLLIFEGEIPTSEPTPIIPEVPPNKLDFNNVRLQEMNTADAEKKEITEEVEKFLRTVKTKLQHEN